MTNNGEAMIFTFFILIFEMMRLISNGWYVLFVKSKQEKKVLIKLLEFEIDAFLPLIKKERQWSDRRKTSFVPLFNSYVFVNIKSSIEFYKSLSISGACSFISFGNTYAIVAQNEIDKLRFLVNIDALEDIVVEQSLPEIGDSKIISHGFLAGFKCEVIQYQNKNKVKLESLQLNIIASIPLEYIN